VNPSEIKLTPIPARRYTITEIQFFNSIPKNGRKVKSQDIVDARMKLGDWDVKYPHKNVSVTMNRLIEKVEENDETFRIFKEARYPEHDRVEYWIGPKPRARKK